MTTTLRWKPAKPSGECLPDDLKHVLRKRFESQVDGTLNTLDIDYLKGLVDCGINGAQHLINAINTHGEIKLYEA